MNNNYNKYLTVGGLVCKMLDYENLSSARVATATIKGKMMEQVRKWKPKVKKFVRKAKK